MSTIQQGRFWQIRRETSMMNWDGLTKKFVSIRSMLYGMGEEWAVVKMYKKPWKFYRENETDEIIAVLIAEVHI